MELIEMELKLFLFVWKWIWCALFVGQIKQWIRFDVIKSIDSNFLVKIIIIDYFLKFVFFCVRANCVSYFWAARLNEA